MAEWVKDLVLSRQGLWLLLQYRLDPWPGNFCMAQVWQKKKEEEQKHLGDELLCPTPSASLPLSILHSCWRCSDISCDRAYSFTQ